MTLQGILSKMITSPTTWFVYILQCADDSLYTGVTTNLKRRVHEHNHLKCGAKYTRARRPAILVYSEEQRNRSDACKREYQLKQFSHQQKLHLVSNSPSPSKELEAK